MIVLKILLWIILAILGLVVLLLVLPVKAEVSYIEEKLRYKVKYSLIPVMDSDGGGLLGWLKKRRKKKAPPEEDDPDWDDLPELDDDFGDLPDIPEEIPQEPAADSSAGEKPADTAAETAAAEETAAEEISAEETVSDESTADEKADDEESGKKKKKEKAPKEPRTLGEKLEMLLDLWRAADRPVLKIFKGIKLSDLYIDFIIADEDAYKCALNYGRISGAVFNLLGWLSVLFTVKLKTIDVNAGFALDKSRWDAAVKVSFRLGTLVIAGLWFLITYIFRYFIPGKLRDRKIRRFAARQK